MSEPTRTVIYFSTVRDFKKWVEEESDDFVIEHVSQFGSLLLIVIKKLPLKVEGKAKEKDRVALVR
jgi:hypothetical protein